SGRAKRESRQRPRAPRGDHIWPTRDCRGGSRNRLQNSQHSRSTGAIHPQVPPTSLNRGSKSPMSHQPTGSEARRKVHMLAGARRWAGAIAAFAAVGTSAVAHADPAPKRGSGFAPAAPLSALAIAPSNARLPVPPPAPEWQVTDGVITRGQTLSEMLRA